MGWIASLPDQRLGKPEAYCETGDLYVAFNAIIRVVGGDIAYAEHLVALNMAENLDEYLFNNRAGPIYWRVMPEIYIVHPADSVLAKARCRVFRARADFVQPGPRPRLEGWLDHEQSGPPTTDWRTVYVRSSSGS